MQIISDIQNYISASWLLTQANLYLYLNDFGPRVSLPTGSPSISVETNGHELRPTITFSILQASNPASIKYLRIDWEMDSKEQHFWDEFMSSLSGLEQLSVSSSWDQSKVLKALTCQTSPPTGTHAHTPLPTVPCPSLIALEMDIYESISTNVFDVLLECIHSRIALSHPMERLRLVRPRPSSRHPALELYMQSLNKVVKVEVCDEYFLGPRHVVGCVP